MVDDLEENELLGKGYKHIAGVDESGMGALSGEVTAGVVILPANIDYINLLPGLDDSKKKTPAQRERLYELITKHAVAYAVGYATLDEIEEHNIYWARFIAVERALDKLAVPADYILIDGNAHIPGIALQKAIVKGDGKSISIAAASIIAKVDRDRYMKKIFNDVHPDYDWASNKGYYSNKHKEALNKHGATKYHRKQFVSKFV